MDVSNLTKAHIPSATPPVVQKASASSAGGNTPTVPGNSLPELGQVHVHSEKLPNTNSIPQSNPDELLNLVNHANTVLQAKSSDLKFTVAEGTDIKVVRIEDSETGEIIRQFPSEAMVAIARALGEIQSGVMLEEKA